MISGLRRYHPGRSTCGLRLRNQIPLRRGRKRKAGHSGATHLFVLEELHLHARLNGPVVTLARIILGSLLLNECLVETEIVPDAILPTGVAVLVV